MSKGGGGRNRKEGGFVEAFHDKLEGGTHSILYK